MNRDSVERRRQPDDDADERQRIPWQHDHVLHLVSPGAPSARRMPISCVRCSTEYAINP